MQDHTAIHYDKHAMPKFAYKVRDTQNRVLGGTTEGTDVDEVVDRLTERNLTPLNIDELNFDGTRKDETFVEKVNNALLKFQTRVPYKTVVFFTRQLATMVNAGVPIAHALDQLATAEKPGFSRILHAIADDIAMGSAFSDAIGRHPGAFDDVYVALVHSGEVSGSLDRVLEELATYMENVQAMKEKVKGAMRYPIFIGGFVVLLIIAILWKLVPVFENLYASFNAQLPLPTQILISISNGIRDNGLQFFGIIAAVIIAFFIGMTRKKFKRFIHKSILFIPVFGGILRKNILARFCRTMAVLLGSGTPILQATEISGAVVGNQLYSENLERVFVRLRTGELLSQALAATGQFPVLICQLTATGEAAGRIEDLLGKAADFYEREIRVTVDSLAAIIEPFLIIILGGVVGLILIALYFPVFTLGKLMRY
ncbi:MAG: hypothetical protein GF350_09665 [Chitinivibrionales bacterium]|nr:hypothetical protein [Chitinivibrionales bacterium]